MKANEGKIAVSWNETTKINMEEDATLFQLSFTALQNGQLSDLLSINSSLTMQEAYQANLRKDVVLDFGKSDLASMEFTLLDNKPNPFTQETLIDFHLPEATEATLTIFNLAGQIVWTQTQAYESGMHQTLVTKDRLEGSGVYYYQLSTSKATAIQKMILVK